MAEKAGKKINYLSLEKKVEVIKYAQRNPGTNVRDLGALFSCGKTQIAQILKIIKILYCLCTTPMLVEVELTQKKDISSIRIC